MTIISFIIFILSLSYAYKRMAEELRVNIYYEHNVNINILNEKYRKAISNYSTLKNLMICLRSIFINLLFIM